MSKRVGASRLFYRAVLALAVVAVSFGAAQAAVSFHGLTFPERVGGAELGETHDFEKSDPGLGYGVRYQKPGWAIDVYIYDLSRSSIPDEVSSEILKAQLAQGRSDIFELEKRGTYSKVKQIGAFDVKDRGGRARFICETFTYTREAMGNVDSFLCLTGWHNKFIKYRLTTAHRAGSVADAKSFMEAWLPVLWP
jgi:hypothetical protein